jgi:hypothetical protein
MPVLKDKHTGRMIAFNKYDSDVTVTNSLAQKKKVRGGTPANILTRNNWNMSKTCRSVSSYEDIEIENPNKHALPERNKYAGGRGSNRYNC